jgi:hypothetical protein
MTRARDVANIDGLLTTTGDTYYASAAGTPARLGIGSTGNVLTVSGGVPTWSAPAGGGKVLQVVQDTLVTGFTTSSATYVDTGLTVTITPSSATSKIMVFVSGPNAYSSNSGSVVHNYSVAQVVRNSTTIMIQPFGTYNYAASTNPSIYIPLSMMTLDSPATTSAITYKVQAKVGSSSAFNIDGSATDINSIIVMEIGA